MTKIGNNLKKIRNTKNLSQQSFAELFNINRGNISSYEENRAEPRIETLLSIANYFSIPLENLLIKELTVNEILQFNADKLLEDEQKMATLKIKEVPFINEDTLAKALHKDISFAETDTFPLLKIPDTGTQAILAVQFNPNITHHQFFTRYKSEDVLFFRKISTENIHLIDNKNGLFIESHKLTFGRFEKDKKNTTHFIINELNKIKLDKKNENQFWKFFAALQHE